MVRCALLLSGVLVSGCSLSMDQSGPTADAGWIRSRALGGVTLDMNADSLVKDLSALGYVARYRKGTDGHGDDIVTAHGTPARHSPDDVCIPSKQPVELAISIRSGRIARISCLTDGSRTIDRYTNRFTDTVNGIKGVEVSVAAVDHVLTSFRALNAADMCPFLTRDPYRTLEDANFCKDFSGSSGPYIYSYSLKANRFPSGNMNAFVIHN